LRRKKGRRGEGPPVEESPRLHSKNPEIESEDFPCKKPRNRPVRQGEKVLKTIDRAAGSRSRSSRRSVGKRSSSTPGEGATSIS